MRNCIVCSGEEQFRKCSVSYQGNKLFRTCQSQESQGPFLSGQELCLWGEAQDCDRPGGPSRTGVRDAIVSSLARGPEWGQEESKGM